MKAKLDSGELTFPEYQVAQQRSKDELERNRTFDVHLTAIGSAKLQVINQVLLLTSLGLKEAKDLVDGAPANVLEGVDEETANKAKEALEAAGASVELK